ncbi:MAG: hypothetical protein WC505_05630 [Patescibacteria group bacterium]
MPITLTPEIVKAFYAAITKQYGFSILDKSDSSLMKLVSNFLDGLNIMNKTDFMEQCTTTIFDKVYCPFTPGIPDDHGYSLEEQVGTAIHEAVHCNQYHDEPVKFPVFYLCNKSDRAEYESQAYAADLEWFWYRRGHGYDVKQRAQSLLSYGLDQNYCDFMAQYLEVQNDVFRQGGGISPEVTWAREWLEAYGK